MNSHTFKDVQSKYRYSFGLELVFIFLFVGSELTKIKSKAKSKGELKEVASCCNVLGELFQQQGKFQDAIIEHKVWNRFIYFDTGD